MTMALFKWRLRQRSRNQYGNFYNQLEKPTDREIIKPYYLEKIMTQPQIKDIFNQRYNQTKWKQFLKPNFC